MSINPPGFANVTVKPPKNIKSYSEEDRAAHCEAWRRSGLSMNQYCRHREVSVSALSQWLKKIPMDSLTNAVASPRPASINGSAVEVILKSGIRLRFPEIASFADLLNMIQELEACL
jgi:transposase-like protein